MTGGVAPAVPVRVAIRTDAALWIGAGHVMRCLTLAEALRAVGCAVRFISRAHDGHLIDLIERRGFVVEQLPGAAVGDIVDQGGYAAWLGDTWEHDAELTSAVLAAGPCWDWLVVDHYALGAHWEATLRAQVGRLMVIDDLANREHHCDLLLDQTPGRTPSAYRELLPTTAQVLAGPCYALLRAQFLRRRAAALARHDGSHSVQRMLVALGGVDRDNLSGQVLQALDRVAADFAVDVVVGSACPHQHALRGQALHMPREVHVHQGVDDMAALSAAADVAIGAAGVSALERCALGLPSLVWILADNQRPGALGMAQAGAVRLAAADPCFPRAMAVEIENFVADATRLQAMSRAAAAHCDALGAVRVVAALLDLRSRDGGAVGLRPATAEDAQLMFDWQCDPVTRRFAHDPRPPDWDQHVAWLARKLANPGCLFLLITEAEVPVGVLRLDHLSTRGGCYLISILVAPARQRQGLAAHALTLAKALLPDSCLRAEVLGGNEASHRLFSAAGFDWIDDAYHWGPAT